MGFAPALGFQVTHDLGKESGGTFNLEPDLHHLDVHFGGSVSFMPDASNRVGELIANAGLMAAGVPAVGSFTVETASPGYVKVVAVDRSGNRSNASEAVAVTPRLLRDEHIDSLTASKITAGTIETNELNAVTITTALAGARVELNKDGLYAYDSNGAETVGIETDGSATFTGEVKTLVNGDGVSLLPGALPKIRLTPNDAYDHEALIRCWNSGLGTVVDFGIRRTDDPEQADGGNLLMWEAGVSLSHYSVDTDVEQFLAIDFPTAGRFHSRGKWPVTFFQADDGLETQIRAVSAGFGGASYTYGPTMSGGIAPMVTAQGASPDFFWCVSASNTTGYTIAWSGTGAKTIFSWVYRN